MGIEPRCHIPTIRSRLKRHGRLRMKQLTPDAFIVHKGDEILTGVLTLSQLERWSWDHSQGSNHEKHSESRQAADNLQTKGQTRCDH